jgi:hypothetical protein
VVERQLPKLNVVGSIPIARSSIRDRPPVGLEQHPKLNVVGSILGRSNISGSHPETRVVFGSPPHFPRRLARDSEANMRRKLIIYCEACGSDTLTSAVDFILYHHLSFCSPDCRDDYRIADEQRADKTGGPRRARPEVQPTDHWTSRRG